MTGSARLVQEARQRDATQQQPEELVRRRRELRRGIAERDAQPAVLQDELVADRAELQRLDVLEQPRPPTQRPTRRRWPRSAGPIRTRETDERHDGHACQRRSRSRVASVFHDQPLADELTAAEAQLSAQSPAAIVEQMRLALIAALQARHAR